MIKNPFGSLPAFIFSYPFSVLLVVRLYAVVCNIAILFIWHSTSPSFATDNSFTFVVIADLITLLLIIISLWFTIQKFFYVKLDAILSTISIIFVICGLSAASSTEVDPKNNDLFYIIICHLYLFIAQFFSLVFTVICAKNTVSRLFIDVFSVFSIQRPSISSFGSRQPSTSSNFGFD
ncbi:nucleoprotein [Aphelenchoides besseyi]|nr:nucleoprotein [Aphelenchoides besseyi]